MSAALHEIGQNQSLTVFGNSPIEADCGTIRAAMARYGSKSAPLDEDKLQDLAVSYVARFATTRAKLEDYLRRKVRERGWEPEGAAPVEEIAMKMVDAGYVDDLGYARAKSGSLLRRGYGPRRVSQALGMAGIDEGIADEVAPTEAEQRLSALSLVRRRGFGPFGENVKDPAKREKQLAAMQRAGHSLSLALALIDAPTTREAECWAAEALELD